MSQAEGTSKTKTKKSRRTRKQGIYTKLVLYPFLIFMAMVIGMYVGYAVVGNGNGSEIFNLQTWKHMYDLVFAQ